jgi:hypothetical protein
MRRISIRTLMAFVIASAVGLAALRNAEPLWARLMLLTALSAVGIAGVGAIFTRRKERAWWVGFGVFCGGYLSLAYGPWLSERFEAEVEMTQLLGEIYIRIVPFVPNTPANKTVVQTWYNNRKAFVQISHSLFALLSGLVGGTIAVWFYVRREREENRREEATSA